MPQRILLGQVWRKTDTKEDFLVTRVGQEVFANFAVLRKVGDESSPSVRINIKKAAEASSNYVGPEAPQEEICRPHIVR